jgi:chromate transporter
MTSESAAEGPQATTITPVPKALQLALTWMTIGTQSVGGGPSTLYLMRQLIVERHGWISLREFLEDWALSRLSMGVHLIALCGLIGARLGGFRGATISVAAMLTPAVAITILITAGYSSSSGEPLVRAALAGIGPVTAGLAIGMSLVLIQASTRSGRNGVVDRLLAVAAISAGLLAPTSPLPVLAAGLAIGVLFLGGEHKKSPRVEGQ